MSLNEYINTLKQKLNTVNDILAKLRYHVSADTLKTICYALFDSHMRHACQIWGKIHSKTVDMIQSAQKKALRIINFKQSMEQSEPLYQKLKINKSKNNIILSNCLLVFDKLTNNLRDVFDQFFQPLKEQHNYNTMGSQQYLLNIPKANTQMFGSNSIKIRSIKDWNEIVRKIHFSSELLVKRAEFIKLVNSTSHDK